jgi:hypothetical protein
VRVFLSISFIIGLLLALLSWMPCPLQALSKAEKSPSHTPTASEMAAVNQYSNDLGRQVLKDQTGLDVNSLNYLINPQAFSFGLGSFGPGIHDRSTAIGISSAADCAAAAGVLPPALDQRSSFSMGVDQQGDLLRLARDVRDIPFGLHVRSEVPIHSQSTSVQTSLWLPFSWRDEIKAEASIPLRNVNLGLAGTLFKELGLKDNLGLNSDYSNKLGVNQVETGLGSLWTSQLTGPLNLDYDYSQRFGQGLDENTHWLKLRKDF